MWNVIYALFFRELKTRFGKNRRLGYFWLIAEPMMQVIFIAGIISLIRSYQFLGYKLGVIQSSMPIFLFLSVGIIPFFMFRNIVGQLMGGIGANLGLFIYRPVKPIHVFIARTLLETFLYFFIFVILMLVLAWFFDYPATPSNFLEFYASFLVLVLSGFSLGLILAIIAHFFHVLRSLIGYFIMILYFTSAVLFPSWILPNRLFNILLYNPWFHIMESLKAGYFELYPLREEITLFYPLSVSMILLYIGLWVYYYKRQELTAKRDDQT